MAKIRKVKVYFYSFILFLKTNIPFVKVIYDLNSDRNMLQRAVNYLFRSSQPPVQYKTSCFQDFELIQTKTTVQCPTVKPK